MTYDKAALRNELIRDEGKRVVPYKDSLGYWTVGIGHLLQGEEKVKILNKGAISEDECYRLFEGDIARAEETLDQVYPKWRRFDDVRQRAVLNLAFNLGNRLANFKNFLSAMAAKDYHAAGEALRQSKWFTQVKGRAPRIIFMIETGAAWLE